MTDEEPIGSNSEEYLLESELDEWRKNKQTRRRTR